MGAYENLASQLSEKHQFVKICRRFHKKRSAQSFRRYANSGRNWYAGFSEIASLLPGMTLNGSETL